MALCDFQKIGNDWNDLSFSNFRAISFYKEHKQIYFKVGYD